MSAPAAAFSAPTASPISAAQADMVVARMRDVLASESETYRMKLDLINKMFGKVQQFPSHLSQLADYLQVYPHLLIACFDELNEESADSTSLLDSCVLSVHHLLRISMRSSSHDSKSTLSLLSHLLTLTLHTHAFVAEFFTQQWMLLQGQRDKQFEEWSVRVLVELLRKSGAVEGATANSQHQQWYLNLGQSRLLELLVHLAPDMSRVNQIFLFQHFNLLLADSTTFTPNACDTSKCLPLAVQSAFLLAVPIEKLHAEIQHVLYTHTLPCCVAELEFFAQEPNAKQQSRFSALMFCLESIVGFCKSSATSTAATLSLPPPPHASLLTSAPSIAACCQKLLVTFGATFHSEQIDATVSASIMRALISCLQCDLISRSLTPMKWLSCIDGVRRACVSGHTAMHVLLGDALIALAHVPLPDNDPASLESFFKSLVAPFHFLLTPAPGIVPADMYEVFYVISSTASKAWSSKLKELIFPPIHTDLVVYVKARGKEKKREVVTPQMRPTMKVTTTIPPTSAAAAATSLPQPDGAQLAHDSAQLSQRYAEIEAQPQAIQRRLQLVERQKNVLAFAAEVMEIEINQDGNANSMQE